MSKHDDQVDSFSFTSVSWTSRMVPFFHRSRMSVPPTLGPDGAYVVPSARECSMRLP
jgi:hypothetical protein